MRVMKLLDKKGYEVHTISPDAMVYDALKIMAEKKIGALVVLENDKMVGIMSERDYARKVILKGKTSSETQVGEIMTRDVISAQPTTKLKKCFKLMTKNHIRHMPIIEDNRLVGIISIDDVMQVT